MDEADLADRALFYALHSRIVSEIFADAFCRILLRASTVDILALNFNFVSNRERAICKSFKVVETFILVVVECKCLEVVSTIKALLYLKAAIVLSILRQHAVN